MHRCCRGCNRWRIDVCQLAGAGRNRETLGEVASADAGRWLSDRPRRPFGPLFTDGYCSQTLVGRGGSVSRRDHNEAYWRCVYSQAEPTKKKAAPQTLAALRERGSGGEGKDSHSRQWRLWLPFSTETSGHWPRRLRLRNFSQRSRLSPRISHSQSLPRSSHSPESML